MKIRKLLSALLALAMVLTLLPGTVLAEAGEPVSFDYYMEAPQLYSDTQAPVYDGPKLAEGNYAQWYDRLGDLPDYAAELYQWLEDNAGADGALADPTVATVDKGSYIYVMATLPAEVSYTYADGEDPQEKAEEAVVAHCSDVFSVAMSYAVAVFSAFDRDHPEVFWLTGSSNYSWSLTYNYDHSGGSGTASYSMDVKFILDTDGFDIRQSQYQDTQVLTQAIEQRETYIQQLLEDVPAEAPVAERIRYLNRVLTETNAYNVSASSSVSLTPWKSISALSGGADGQGPVCEGYARAFKVLCDRLGIGCTLVDGGAIATADGTPEDHMWNYVLVDDQWYAVDVTWNDPVSSLEGDPVLSGNESEDWLLLGSDTVVAEGLTFLQSHPVENLPVSKGIAFTNGPVLAAEAYVQPQNYMDIAPYRSAEGYTAPTMEGLLFGGWYADEALTQPLAEDVTSGWAYAKFVDEATLTVKFQLTADTTAASEKTDLRLLTAVDDLSYQDVSFRVELGETEQTLHCEWVYQSVRAGDMVISDASSLFGPDAAYFVTYTILDTPQSVFDMTFTVTTGWTTLDGTPVQGAVRSFQISDAF